MPVPQVLDTLALTDVRLLETRPHPNSRTRPAHYFQETWPHTVLRPFILTSCNASVIICNHAPYSRGMAGTLMLLPANPRYMPYCHGRKTVGKPTAIFPSSFSLCTYIYLWNKLIPEKKTFENIRQIHCMQPRDMGRQPPGVFVSKTFITFGQFGHLLKVTLSNGFVAIYPIQAHWATE